MHCEIATAALKVQYYTHRKRPVEGSRIFCSASRPSSQDCSAASHTRLLLYTLAVRRALPRMEELRFMPPKTIACCACDLPMTQQRHHSHQQWCRACTVPAISSQTSAEGRRSDYVREENQTKHAHSCTLPMAPDSASQPRQRCSVIPRASSCTITDEYRKQCRVSCTKCALVLFADGARQRVPQCARAAGAPPAKLLPVEPGDGGGLRSPVRLLQQGLVNGNGQPRQLRRVLVPARKQQLRSSM